MHCEQIALRRKTTLLQLCARAQQKQWRKAAVLSQWDILPAGGFVLLPAALAPYSTPYGVLLLA